MKRRLNTLNLPAAGPVKGSVVLVTAAILAFAAPSVTTAQQSDGPDLVLSLSVPSADRAAPDTSALIDTPRPQGEWARITATFTPPRLPPVEYRAPISMAPGHLSQAQAQISGWLPVPAGVAPHVSVRNRLANYSGRRALSYVDPTLRGHASRLYSVGFSLSF